ncbi:hypothetical protein [Methylocystis iwaonis]|uniref:hypothetical protein n=1 Tax=Methylocystis iwaonis TaxID=2885079 RepID=UPI002E7ACFCB|nr:hypothetical protein [Methylocystis iwaonis]
METPIVFINQGMTAWLSYAVEQAERCGYRTIVLGDAESRNVTKGEFYLLDEFSGEADAFAAKYRHIGVNSPVYELFCYKRWFYLNALMKRLGVGVVHVDSDVLVYPGLSQIYSYVKPGQITNVPWINVFDSTQTLEFYLSFLHNVYDNECELDELSKKYAHEGTPHLSDMCLLYELGERAPTRVVNFKDFGHLIGFDNNFRDFQGYLSHQNHKLARFRDGIPYVARDVGGLTRFFMFHFQGVSKPLMQKLHTLPREVAAGMPSLEFWFSLEGAKNTPGYDAVLKLYYELP